MPQKQPVCLPNCAFCRYDCALIALQFQLLFKNYTQSSYIVGRKLGIIVFLYSMIKIFRILFFFFFLNQINFWDFFLFSQKILCNKKKNIQMIKYTTYPKVKEKNPRQIHTL